MCLRINDRKMILPETDRRGHTLTYKVQQSWEI